MCGIGIYCGVKKCRSSQSNPQKAPFTITTTGGPWPADNRKTKHQMVPSASSLDTSTPQLVGWQNSDKLWGQRTSGMTKKVSMVPSQSHDSDDDDEVIEFGTMGHHHPKMPSLSQTNSSNVPRRKVPPPAPRPSGDHLDLPGMTSVNSNSVSYDEERTRFMSIEEAKEQTGADKEKWLNDSDFYSVFGMDKETFYGQPAWKQKGQKRSKGFF